MKKVILLLIIIFVGIGFYVKSFFTRFNTPSEIQTVTINGKSRRFLIADNEIERTNGLMNIRSLPNVDGMVFLFDKPKVQIFWNQNTFLDLDVYWMNKGKVVGHDFLPSIEKSKSVVIIQSAIPVDTVVEVIRKENVQEQ